jgi:Flp pilus assembly pilin Flp
VLIAVVIVGSVTLLGSRTADLFQRSCGSIASAESQSC